MSEKEPSLEYRHSPSTYHFCLVLVRFLVILGCTLHSGFVYKLWIFTFRFSDYTNATLEVLEKLEIVACLPLHISLP